jgi:hypothetical protein
MCSEQSGRPTEETIDVADIGMIMSCWYVNHIAEHITLSTTTHALLATFRQNGGINDNHHHCAQEKSTVSWNLDEKSRNLVEIPIRGPTCDGEDG